jgi:hypothetical protein
MARRELSNNGLMRQEVADREIELMAAICERLRGDLTKGR